MTHPVQPEMGRLSRNDISDLNLNQRHLPPVKKYQIVFRSGNFLFHVENRYISIKNRQIQAILTTFDIVMAGIISILVIFARKWRFRTFS